MKFLLLCTSWILLAANPLAGRAENEPIGTSESRVHLREAAEVKGNRVWLSDLLPADAPSPMRQAGAAMELFQAPQLGSVRVLNPEQIRVKLAGQPEVLRQVVIPPRITIRHAGWAITEETLRLAISKSLREQGHKRDLPDQAKLEWPRPLSATEEHPALQVTGLDWDNRQHSVQVRLRCATRASCGSFLVHVVLPALPGSEWRDRMGSGLNSSLAGEPATATAGGAVLAERGKPATLILDEGSMRISVRVICLQPGVLNQQIRVFDPQSRHVFRAEVVGAGRLHSTL